MKKYGTALLVAVLALSLAPAQGEEKHADYLKALDAKLTQAFKNHDIKMLEEHAAPHMMVIDPLGRVHNRKEYFEHMGQGNFKISELNETDIKARIYGDTGVVTGLLTLKAMAGNRDLSGDYRWTRVYVKEGGEWKVVTEQHTYVLPKDAIGK
jgi:ketosteroid isomerase-like protein